MNQGVVVVIPILVFTVLDFLIFFKTLADKGRSYTQKIFRNLAFLAGGFSLTCAIERAAHFELIRFNSTVPQYIVGIGIMVFMTACAYCWFDYLRVSLTGKDDLVWWGKLVHMLPSIVLVVAAISSPWTHWVFFIDENLHSQRGTLFFLQTLCPYTYAIVGFTVMAVEIIKGNGKKIAHTVKYFAFFIIPTVIGAIMNIKVFSGGYTQMGVSVAMILMYMEMYVEENKENYKLESLEGINEELTKANEEQRLQIAKITGLNEELNSQRLEMEKEIRLIDALSNSFTNIYLIHRDTQLVEVIKLNGYIIDDLASGKPGPYNYTVLCRSFINNRVYAEDVEYMTGLMEWNNMIEGISSNKKYEGNYRVIEDKVFHYYQVRYRAVANTDFIICVFLNIDSIVQEEQKQKNALEKALVAAESANNAKSAFLFNMSHDIRTPMNAIMGFTDLMEKNFGDREKCLDYLAKIRSSSTFLLSLINDVLEMARIESGKAVLEESVCDIRAISNELYTVFEEEMGNKHITFIKEVDCQTDYIYCDVVKVQEIFLNILSNAHKYTPEGGTIKKSLKELPSDREGYALLQTTISDTGIGMSEEYLPHLFEEFTREQTVTESKISGTGLGMPIVKKLVNLMGGTITVNSKQGEGTTFVITIYHKKATKEEFEKVPSSDNILGRFAGKRILLAEDNDLNAEIVCEILKECGFEIERAEDGVACVRMISEAPAEYYDLILMDIQMPNMNGYQATEAIRGLEDAKKAGIPIIALTANAYEEDRRNALRAGMNGHLGKPIVIDKMMETLAKILK